MRTSPSIVPYDADHDTYLVLEDFGHLGCCWRETDVTNADRETLIRDLVEGQYRQPVRIVAFNTAAGWSRDVTADIADELRRRQVDFGELPDAMHEFIEANRR
jgi:hypothetical protein